MFWVLFLSEGKMEFEIHRLIGAVFAAMWSLPTVHGEEGEKLKGQALDLPFNQSYHLLLW